jgi:hypothetical protein
VTAAFCPQPVRRSTDKRTRRREGDFMGGSWLKQVLLILV